MGGGSIPPPLQPEISPWRREPFRIFVPMGVLLAWVGVSHWLLYATGVAATYSCMFHGLVQMQAPTGATRWLTRDQAPRFAALGARRM